jgi:hypothetical protein
MHFTFLICILLLLNSCSIKSFAPTIGGGVGAGIGSIGGIPGAVAGGTLGAGVGQLVHELDRNKEAQQTISALTQGDVEKLVKIQMEDQKSWVTKALDGIKSLLLIVGVGFGLYILIPIVYTRHLGRKIKDIKSGNE